MKNAVVKRRKSEEEGDLLIGRRNENKLLIEEINDIGKSRRKEKQRIASTRKWMSDVMQVTDG